jgi:hypothetical protein
LCKTADRTHAAGFIAGVPRFVYREFLQQGRRWLGRVGRSDGLALLIEELRPVEYVGFFSEIWRSPMTRAKPPSQRCRGPAGEASDKCLFALTRTHALTSPSC